MRGRLSLSVTNQMSLSMTGAGGGLVLARQKTLFFPSAVVWAVSALV
jgi:hypothetical protein